MVRKWTKDPITVEFIKIIKDRRDADRSHIAGIVENNIFLDRKNQHLISKLNGQVQVFNAQEDLLTFLYELYEWEDEKKYADYIGTKDIDQSETEE